MNHRRLHLALGFALWLAGLVALAWPASTLAADRLPNVILIFLDDSGWGDFRPFAPTAYPTPNVDRLAREGCCYDHFYVPQAVCSASRGALMTGCYPGRTKVFGALGPRARGLDPKFATLGEVLRHRGYATAVFGKWHLGDQPDTRPPARGFDESAGLMYSNDMWEFHPENPKHWSQWPLQFWDNGRITIERVTKEHQPMLTTWYTERAASFIQRNKDRPFFLYLPHSMPHVPLFCSEKFRGKSGAGLYGDVMMELDWSVGQVMAAVRAAGIEEHTLMIFTSDNGPWISYGNHAGKTPFREAKGTGFDGGIRSACIMKYPGRIAAGSRSQSAFGSIDILPTLAHLAGAPLPKNPIDGSNVWDLIAGREGARNPHAGYFFGTGNQFEGVISGDGRWKLHRPHSYRTLVEPGQDGAAGKYRAESIDWALFDLGTDPLEKRNVISDHADAAARLRSLVEQHAREFYP